MTPKEVHLGFKGARDVARYRAYTIGELPPVPLVCTEDPALNIKNMAALVDWLDVEGSARWAPSGSKTYCNVYASDAAYLLGGYLPRVWWRPDYVATGGPVIYSDTVFEMGANGFPGWLGGYGRGFGWVVTEYSGKPEAGFARTLSELGTFGVISARRVGGKGSGHITLALPDAVEELSARPASGSGHVLQSQAGTTNKSLFRDDRWYLSTRFERVVFAIWTGSRPIDAWRGKNGIS